MGSAAGRLRAPLSPDRILSSPLKFGYLSRVGRVSPAGRRLDIGENTSHYVVLDRDGVINVERPGSVLSREAFELLPGAAEAIAELNRKGYSVLVITNQGCVGRGELELDELEAIHAQMLDEVTQAGGHIDDTYVCPHIDEDGCDCRKPKPGLINRARGDYDFDSAVTWFIGDTVRDVGAVSNAGCRFGLVTSGQDGAEDRMRT